MTTERQIEANRRNAQRSTGPRTPEGRANSRNNALKHGVTAKRFLIPGEDPDEAEEYRAALVEALAPVGALEKNLAERIVDLEWRWLRCSRAEAGLFNATVPEHREQALGVRDSDLGAAFQLAPDGFARLSRYEANLLRALQQAYNHLERLQARRPREKAPRPRGTVRPPVTSDEEKISQEEILQQPPPSPSEEDIDESRQPSAPAAASASQASARPTSSPVTPSAAARTPKSTTATNTTPPATRAAPASPDASEEATHQSPGGAPGPAPTPTPSAAAPSHASPGSASSGPMSASPYDMASIYPWMSRQNAASIYPWMSPQKTSPYPWISPQKWEEYMRRAGLII